MDLFQYNKSFLNNSANYWGPNDAGWNGISPFSLFILNMGGIFIFKIYLYQLIPLSQTLSTTGSYVAFHICNFFS